MWHVRLAMRSPRCPLRVSVPWPLLNSDRIGAGHMRRLTGLVATRDEINLLTFLSLHHDPRIVKLDTVVRLLAAASLL